MILTDSEKLELALYMMFENQVERFNDVCKVAEKENIDVEDAYNRYYTPGYRKSIEAKTV